MYSKAAIARIISKRDNITIEEAQDLVQECQYVINESIDYFISGEITLGDLSDDIEEILANYLGLEPDYMMAFIW